jgi:glycosyltransferase involved in cell wall biosynthesis
LEETVRKTDLANVEFIGFSTDPKHEMSAFDIFVLPSLKEGFPYVILEAMAAGLPIVATCVGGVPEAVVEGKGGFLVEPGDAESLARKIAILVESGDLRRSMGEFNRARVREEFSIERMISQTRRVYDEVLESENPFRPV